MAALVADIEAFQTDYKLEPIAAVDDYKTAIEVHPAQGCNAGLDHSSAVVLA